MSRWLRRDRDQSRERAPHGRPEKDDSRAPDERRERTRPTAERGPRTRRDRARDPHERRVPFEERKRLALEDLAIYRAVSFRDLSDARFGGNDFAARRGLTQLREAGLVVRGKGWGPRGRPFLIVAATAAGVRSAAQRGPADQRRWHGLVKPGEAHHDTAVYRAAREKIAELEGEGFTVRRIRIDAELKSELAKAAERARAEGGPEAARAAQHRVAKELGLPVSAEKVHVPDVQIEFERPGAEPGRANVEVVTASYKGRAIKAKASMGFHLSASGSAALRKMRAVLGGDRMDFGETEGRGGGQKPDAELEF